MAARDRIHDHYLEEEKKFMPIGLYRDEAVADGERDDHEDELTGSVRFISSMSCVDGLILASPDLAIRGFGVEIRTKNEPPSVYLSPSPNAPEKRLRKIDPSHFGTRHRTMMRYCFAHPGSVGFVISQDGDIRAITRVKERLVIWENLKVLDYWESSRKRKKVTSAVLPAPAVQVQ
jgi:hypothetical protein